MYEFFSKIQYQVCNRFFLVGEDDFGKSYFFTKTAKYFFPKITKSFFLLKPQNHFLSKTTKSYFLKNPPITFFHKNRKIFFSRKKILKTHFPTKKTLYAKIVKSHFPAIVVKSLFRKNNEITFPRKINFPPKS